MTNSISELHHIQAANENTYEPDWINDVPDDWSHTVLVSSEHSVFKNIHNENNLSQGNDITIETNTTKAA